MRDLNGTGACLYDDAAARCMADLRLWAKNGKKGASRYCKQASAPHGMANVCKWLGDDVVKHQLCTDSITPVLAWTLAASSLPCIGTHFCSGQQRSGLVRQFC
mmetsp:Transcript_94669/g.187585  ORF Transcript_94669/g.187585 Transcript_94669/m.187585 type:complete len:103 (-) Transcript_94669:54-362(-)